MGYITRSIEADLQTAVFKASGFRFLLYDMPSTMSSYQDIFDCTLDFDEIEYIHATSRHETAGVYIRIEIDGSQEWESNTAGYNRTIIDCTAKTGKLNVKVQIKNTDGAVARWIDEVNVTGQD